MYLKKEMHHLKTKTLPLNFQVFAILLIVLISFLYIYIY